MIDPTEADVGRAVIYTGNYGGPLEDGVITSFNKSAVFVRYGSDKHSKATSREDLRWMTDIKHVGWMGDISGTPFGPSDR